MPYSGTSSLRLPSPKRGIGFVQAEAPRDDFFTNLLSIFRSLSASYIYMKPLLTLKPRSAITVAVTIAIMLIASAGIELWQSRSDLYSLMKENGTSLLRTIIHSSNNAILSSDEIETLVAERIRTVARLVATVDSLTILNRQTLQAIAQEHGIFRIHLFNRWGRRILSNEHLTGHQQRNFDTLIAPLLSRKTNEIIVGFHQARFESGSRFGIGIPRALNRGGAILLNIDATYLTEFRKRIGIGKMIQEIGTGENIEYVVLQDDEGIVAASKGVEEMSSFDQDYFLRDAFNGDSVHIREYDFNGRTVLECVQSFSVEGDKIGLFRVGVSMNALRALEEQMIWRAVIISIVLIVLSAIVIGIVVAQEQAKKATLEFEKIQTYSGMILDNMADAVITINKNGLITIFNKSAYGLCKNVSEPVGNHLTTLLNGQLSFITDTLSSGTSFRNKEIALQCGNELHNVILNSTITKNIFGGIESCTIVLHDVTELRKLEQHIRQKEKVVAMGELAGGVAHEIRNPLNAMYMIAQRFEKEFSPKKKVKEFRSLTSVLKNESQRVNAIIQQFLRFSRPPKLQWEKVSAKQFLDEIQTMFSSEMKAKGISWNVEQTGDFQLKIDKQQFKQALINLIINAMQATEKKGIISLSVSAGNSIVRFVLKDSGKGIPKEQLGKIFDLYFTTKPDGTGLGLSIVQQIVSQHNGTISVESIEGKGTTFTIEIPIGT